LRADAAAHAGSSKMEDVERDHILRVFREAGGVITVADNSSWHARTTERHGEEVGRLARPSVTAQVAQNLNYAAAVVQEINDKNSQGHHQQ
jgi:hypothetical protein